MASYFDLLQAAENDDLNRRMRVAVVIAAETIRTESATTNNHANRLIWAKGVFAAPDATAKTMLMAVLAQNRNSTLAQIVGASDAAVQAAVDAAVDVFATGS